MTDYLFTERQETRLMEIVSLLAKYPEIRSMTDYDNKFDFTLDEIKREFAGSVDDLLDIFPKSPEPKKIRNERLEMLVGSISSILPIAHVLMIAEQKGYSFTFPDSHNSKEIEFLIMKSNAYEKLVDYPLKPNPPMDELLPKNTILLGKMRKKFKERGWKRKELELGNPELKLIARLDNANRSQYLMGNNYGISTVVVEDVMSVLHICGERSVYTISNIELWFPENENYLNRDDYESLLEYLISGKYNKKLTERLFTAD
ncbi:hypothetical protein J4456_00010 [Candidatus Pacearchaeota archaeon]|nr:hypothetical protein [Candidatus Pacearchaeota archaeon]